MSAQLKEGDPAPGSALDGEAQVLDGDGQHLVGSVLAGRYRVVRKLARGGLGTVYEAMHVELERAVAVKVLSPEWARSSEVIKRFQQEARTASQIGHPNIVDVHDLGRLEDGAPFLAMEMLDGLDLDQLLEEEGSPLRFDRVIELLRPVASALDAVHERGIVHRDVKPANIFVARRGDGRTQVKLLDFGLAAFHQRNDRLTQMGAVVGTPHYMPPEAAEGELAGPQGDLYSLGVVMYECLCGSLPFDAGQTTGVLVKKVARRAPTMSERTGRSFSNAVEDVVGRALERSPDARYPTCTELVEALATAGGLPVGSLPEDPRSPLESEETDPAVLPPAAAAGPESAAPEPGPTVEAPSSAATRASVLIGLGLLGALIGAGGWFALGGGRHASATTRSPEPPVEPSDLDPSDLDPSDVEAVDVEPPVVEPPVVEPPVADPPVADPPVADSPMVETPSPAPTGPARPWVGHRPSTPSPSEPTRAEPVEPAPSAEASDPPTLPDDPSAPEGPLTEIDPNSAARAVDLTRDGGRAMLSGQLARASRLYRGATQTDPSHAPAWRGLGVVEEQLGHAPEASRAYRRYLALAPSAPDAAAVRARLARLGGE